MSRVSTRLQKMHQQAIEILKKDSLTTDERWFVYENFHEGAGNLNGLLGAFFTPLALAHEFRLQIDGHKVIDLCAGIGALSFHYFHGFYHETPPEITCVEINPQFVETGKKLLPEANWICADITDPDVIASLSTYDYAYGNPPFGTINSTSNRYLKYQGSQFEYKTIEIASYLSSIGSFIIPQESAPFLYSGVNGYRSNHNNPKYHKFHQSSRLELSCASAGIDTSVFINDWKGTTPMVEIVDYEKSGHPKNPFKSIGKQVGIFA